MSALVWVELPVEDIERAMAFYKELLGAEFELTDEEVRRTATINDTDGGTQVGFSLNESDGFSPSPDGALLYLMPPQGLDAALAEVEEIGGKIVIGKTEMGTSGHYATIHDTEGNTIALYGMPEA